MSRPCCYLCHDPVEENEDICACTGTIGLHRQCALRICEVGDVCTVCEKPFSTEIVLENARAKLRNNREQLLRSKTDVERAFKTFLAHRKFEEALSAIKELVGLLAALFGAHHEEVEKVYLVGYMHLDNAGLTETATTLLHEGASIKRKRLGSSIDVALSDRVLGRRYFSLGSHTEAQEAFKSSIQIFSHVHGAPHKDTAGVADELGTSYFAAGDHTSALAWYQMAANIFSLLDADLHAQTLYNMAIVWEARGNADVAIDCLRHSISVALPEPKIYSRLARLLHDRGEYAKALEMYQNDLEHISSDEEAAVVFNAMGVVYQRMGRYAEAAFAFERDLEILTELQGVDNGTIEDTRRQLEYVRSLVES